MLNEKTVRATNFTCVHAGPREGWTDFRLEPPDVPMPTRDKLFLRNLLGSAGLEMSLNVIYENEDGKTCVEYDRPSSLFGQFGNAGIAPVASMLDRKLEDLVTTAIR